MEEREPAAEQAQRADPDASEAVKLLVSTFHCVPARALVTAMDLKTTTR